MINIIRSDLYRVLRSVGIYAALGIIVLLIALSIYTVSPGVIGQVSVGDAETGQSYYSELEMMTYEEIQGMSMGDMRKYMLKSEGYELDRDILAYNMNLYYIFIFVAALAVTVDFSAGSVKNTLSSAISRKKYFVSKIVFITGGCLVLFFLNTYIMYFANILFNGKNLSSSLWTVTKISLLQLPPILALISILAGLAFVMKKTSLFNTLTIPLVMVLQMLFSFAVNIFDIDDKYTRYELSTMLGRLAYDPSKSYILHSYILCAVIMIVFISIGYISFRKAEIK